MNITKYRFAIKSNGEIVTFQSEFQKEVYLRYLELNRLTEDNVRDAYTSWKEVQEGLTEKELALEQPSPLPEKYSGDVYEELYEIYKDLSIIGLFACDPELCFDDLIRMTPYFCDLDEDYHPFSYVQICELLTKLGYETHEEQNANEKEKITVIV